MVAGDSTAIAAKGKARFDITSAYRSGMKTRRDKILVSDVTMYLLFREDSPMRA